MNMSLKYRVCGGTDKGRVRDLNEDYMLMTRLGLSEIIFLGVADGVGGLMAGEIASKIALTTLSTTLIQKLVMHYKGVKIFDNAPDSEDDLTISNAIVESIDVANQSVRNILKGAGTTLTAALVLGKPGVSYVVNVGDSRAYIVTEDEIHQITRDHSVPWRDFEDELRKRRWDKIDREFYKWKREYLQKHPQSHTIWNVVGYYGKIGYVDIHKIRLAPGDRLLLATDGLTDMLDDYEIHETVKGRKCSEAVEELIKKANKRGGDDNITVIILEMKDE